MAYGLPTYGEPGQPYTDKFRNSIEAVKLTAEEAQRRADAANQSIVKTAETADRALEVASGNEAYVKAPTDGQIETLVKDPASKTGTALSAANARRGVESVDAHGGDPTGANDSTAAFNAAVAALPKATDGYPVGRVEFSAGTYRFNAPTANLGPYVYVVGKGRFATFVNFYGTGDAFRIYSNRFPTQDPPQPAETFGGGIRDLCIDGANAGAGSSGIHYGDWMEGELAGVTVRNFDKTGSVGLWQDNRIWWTEKTRVEAVLYYNTTNLQLSVNLGATTTLAAAATLPATTLTLSSLPDDFAMPTGRLDSSGPKPQVYVNSQVVTYTGVTKNADGTATLTGCSGGTGALTAGMTVRNGSAGASHGYNVYDLVVYANSGQDGVSISQGANLYGGRLKVRGNFANGVNTNACLRVDGVTPTGTRLNRNSMIQFCELNLQVEAQGPGASQPQTLYLGPGCPVNSAMGIMRFGGTWTPCNVDTTIGRIQFMGFVVGDSKLNPANTTYQPALTTGLILSRGNAPGGSLSPADGEFFYFQLGGNANILLTNGARVAAPQRKVLMIRQNGTTPYTVTWPTGTGTLTNPVVKWPGGTAPTMSTALNAVDIYELVTLDGATYYGTVVGQNYS